MTKSETRIRVIRVSGASEVDEHPINRMCSMLTARLSRRFWGWDLHYPPLDKDGADPVELVLEELGRQANWVDGQKTLLVGYQEGAAVIDMFLASARAHELRDSGALIGAATISNPFRTAGVGIGMESTSAVGLLGEETRRLAVPALVLGDPGDIVTSVDLNSMLRNRPTSLAPRLSLTEGFAPWAEAALQYLDRVQTAAVNHGTPVPATLHGDRQKLQGFLRGGASSTRYLIPDDTGVVPLSRLAQAIEETW